MSLIVIWKILGVFLDTLTVDDKYSLHNSEILPQPNQTQLSQKQISFSEFFAPFLKFALVFEHFQKKDDRHSLYISEITECKRRS